MTKRVRPEGMSDAEHRVWLESFKNRFKHSVKLTQDIEDDYQTFVRDKQLPNDNTALRYLIATHPEIQAINPDDNLTD